MVTWLILCASQGLLPWLSNNRSVAVAVFLWTSVSRCAEKDESLLPGSPQGVWVSGQTPRLGCLVCETGVNSRGCYTSSRVQSVVHVRSALRR